MEVFGNLSKRLRDIEDLPLKVVAVQPISPGNFLVHPFILLSVYYVLVQGQVLEIPNNICLMS